MTGSMLCSLVVKCPLLAGLNRHKHRVTGSFLTVSRCDKEINIRTYSAWVQVGVNLRMIVSSYKDVK